MLSELFAAAVTPFPRPARRMGYLREQIAIRARERRCRAGWAPHRAACREVMLAAADACPAHGRCVVVGGGVCLDIPLAELAARFAEVVLLDVGFLDRSGPGNVRRVAWDAAGSLQRWHDDPAMDDTRALAVSDPGWPSDVGAPDLTVSAGVLSQLHILPAAWLARHRGRPDAFGDALAAALGRLHLDWLRARPGRRLLITDLAEITCERGGREIERTAIGAGLLDLPAPDAAWWWDIAPAPEVDRHHDRRHHVGAWTLADA